MRRNKRKPFRVRFWAKVDKLGPFPDKKKYPEIAHQRCWVWTGPPDISGYGTFWYNRRNVQSHRLSYRLTVEHPFKKGIQIHHKCDNRLCVRPFHLFPGTQADNMKDMDKKGRRSIGENRPAAKLTEEAVIDIRTNYIKRSNHRNLAYFAAKYGVHGSIVRSALIGETWKHIQVHEECR